jgi:hypothetical protein
VTNSTTLEDEFSTRVKVAIYRHFANTGSAPGPEVIARSLHSPSEPVEQAFRQLQSDRVLFLQPDARSIRMAPPFSGVPTEHRVRAGAIEYFANCAWDALGIPAALRRPAIVRSRCGQTGEPLELEVGLSAPPSSPWVFHCPVPASRWWRDLVFT